MRELIRPAWFMIARTGLFLAVLAWGVGQRWTTTSHLAVTRVKLCGAGFLVDNRPASLDWSMSTKSSWEIGPSQMAAIRVYFEDFSEHDVLTRHLRDAFGVKSNLVIPGIRISTHRNKPTIVLAVHHWFTILVFTAFNILLYFIYRKRLEVQPCEN